MNAINNWVNFPQLHNQYVWKDDYEPHMPVDRTNRNAPRCRQQHEQHNKAKLGAEGRGGGGAVAGADGYLHHIHTHGPAAYTGYKDINYSEDNAWKGTLTRCYKKKCHDTMQTDTQSHTHTHRETLGDTYVYVHHVRPITIIFLTFTLFKLQGSVLASSLLLSLYQCLSVSLWREGQIEWNRVRVRRQCLLLMYYYVPHPENEPVVGRALFQQSPNWPELKTVPKMLSSLACGGRSQRLCLRKPIPS